MTLPAAVSTQRSIIYHDGSGNTVYHRDEPIRWPGLSRWMMADVHLTFATQEMATAWLRKDCNGLRHDAKPGRGDAEIHLQFSAVRIQDGIGPYVCRPSAEGFLSDLDIGRTDFARRIWDAPKRPADYGIVACHVYTYFPRYVLLWLFPVVISIVALFAPLLLFRSEIAAQRAPAHVSLSKP